MKIQVRYFAGLRDRRGLGQEDVQVDAKTPLEIYRILNEQHELRLPPEHVRFAIQDAYVDGDYRLKDGHELVLIPPVAGG